jgi:tetratricopeptide (TPR) repeat protein
MRRVYALSLFGLIALAVPAAANVAAGKQALQKGDWAEAEKQFKAAPAVEKGPSLLGLGEVYLLTGKYAEALQHATQAAAVPAVKGRALCLAGEVHRETGKTAEAVKSFNAALAALPKDPRSRIYLGITLHETGKKAEADKVFDGFFQEFNAAGPAAEKWPAERITYVAMAARYLESWQDANDTFQTAVERDPAFTLSNLEWADLFLMKYRADEASKSYADVLKQNRNLPRALIGMARARLEASYDVPGATKLADEALKNNPSFVPAFALKAQLLLDDEHFAPAEALLKKALAVNPVDLQSLALFGASRYLQGDTAGYTEARKKALIQNPRCGDFDFQVGELAVRHHLYSDAVTLNRQALQVEPKNANALAALGTNLLRLGLDKEAEGLKAIAQAFEVDGFNVRTFNTLNLYEEVIAKEYETIPGPVFSYRFNKKEKPLLARYVPLLMQHAWDGYIKKYGFTPRHPITVELFTERQHYGARTIGLPELGAQGTCFGELITAMSPSSAEASWELVLSHELAHVFHLQLSKNRVPRWFTEGLAEYETNVERPYWKREHNRELFLSLKHGDLWKISELSAAFTRPNRPNGVTIAYHQSSLVIHYLADTYGFPKLVEALKLYGEGKRDNEVLLAITGKKVEQLDTEFQDYLRKRYAHYFGSFVFDESQFQDAAKLKAEADAKASDPTALARYAAALLEEKPAEAIPLARKALQADGKHALAHYVLAVALMKTKDVPGAKTEFEAMIANGGDGYEPRMALARIAGAMGDVDEAAKHAKEAKRWDPDEGEPYALMLQLYESKERREDLLKEAEAYLDIQEHDHATARLLVDRFAGDKRWADLVRVAPRVLGTTPMEPFVHQQHGIALAHLNRPKEAAFALQSALIGGLRRPAPTRGLLAKQLLLAGDKAGAKAAAEQTLKEDSQNADAQEVLKKLSQ